MLVEQRLDVVPGEAADAGGQPRQGDAGEALGFRQFGQITQRMAADIRRIYSDTAFTDRIASQGMRPIISTPEEFRAILGPELARWRDVAQKAGVKPE